MLRRRAWVKECPTHFDNREKFHHDYKAVLDPVKQKRSYKPTGKVERVARKHRTDFHTWSVAHGHRHKTFQLILRARREVLGLSPTSSNMHKYPSGSSIGTGCAQ